MLAYDPYIEELVMSDYGVQPVGLDELLQRSDFVSMHAPGTKDAHHLSASDARMWTAGSRRTSSPSKSDAHSVGFWFSPPSAT
jgi:hypothetical protein